MAKMTANVILMGIADNTYTDKKTKERVVSYQAQLYFKGDSTMLAVGIDRNSPDFLASLQKMTANDVQVHGLATVAIREFKGTKFIDLAAFEGKVNQK